jgi:YebC/PmpR family DNA-binding regulatory protein
MRLNSEWLLVRSKLGEPGTKKLETRKPYRYTQALGCTAFTHHSTMSGHSKWASIKHKKGATDAKRGKIFTRHAKLIEIAAREGGGGDPNTNPRLRTVIDSAKGENVPNANIDRAIKKGTGELKDAAQTVAVSYEAYGPEGTAYIVECLTDNTNRTLPNIKTILSKNHGKFAEKGSVSFLFEQKGVVVASFGDEQNPLSTSAREELELAVIDAGAEDIAVTNDTIDITTGRGEWAAVRDLLKAKGYVIETAGLKFLPNQKVEITDIKTARNIVNLLNALEEEEDVSEVHTNANISDDILKGV